MVQNNIFVQEQQEHLPSFYWLPKLHKNPYGARFITASNKCTTKQLSSLLLVLKPYLYIINNTVQEFIRILELIAFAMEVLDRLRNINRTSRAKNFDSFDFSIYPLY